MGWERVIAVDNMVVVESVVEAEVHAVVVMVRQW